MSSPATTTKIAAQMRSASNEISKTDSAGADSGLKILATGRSSPAKAVGQARNNPVAKIADNRNQSSVRIQDFFIEVFKCDSHWRPHSPSPFRRIPSRL